jgi:hypothetical protein
MQFAIVDSENSKIGIFNNLYFIQNNTGNLHDLERCRLTQEYVRQASGFGEDPPRK